MALPKPILFHHTVDPQQYMLKQCFQRTHEPAEQTDDNQVVYLRCVEMIIIVTFGRHEQLL